MSITATHHETDVSDANASSYPTGSHSPTANRLQLIDIQLSDTNPVLAPTVTGCGLTWVAEGTGVEYDTAGTRHAIFRFRALGASPTTGALTITATEAMSGCGWSWSEYAGIDTSGTSGSGAIVQTVTNSGVGTTLSATLAAFGDAANGVAVGFSTDADSVYTAGGGYTILGQDVSASASPTASIGQEWRADNDTSPDATIGASAAWGIIASELKAAATYTPPLGLSYRVAFAFGVAAGTVPTPGQWTYFDGHVKSLEIAVGRNRETEEIQPSRCRIKLDDPTRSLEPDYSASPHSPNVVPMTPVKVEAWYRTGAGSTMYPRFTGYVDDFEPLWNRAMEVVVPCSDAAALLQAATLRHPYVAAVLKDSPLGAWRFSETGVDQPAADASGNNRAATYSGAGITFSQSDPITDTVDGAILLDGTTGYVLLPSTAVPDNTAAFAIVVWFRTANNPVYLFTARTAPGYDFRFLVSSTPPGGKVAVDGDGTGHVIESAASFNDDVWHQAVFTFNGTTGELLVDGVSRGTSTFSFADPWLSGGFGNVYGVGGFAAGTIDEGATFQAAPSGTRVAAWYAARNAWLGQGTGARVAAVLDAAQWAWGASLDTGLVTLQSVGDLEGTTAWAHVLEVTGRSGENGLFFIAPDGTAVLHDGQWPLRNTAVQGTYGDTSGELRFERVEPESSNSTIRNEWRGQRQGGPLQITSDAASVTRYLRRSEPQGGGAISFVIESDAKVLSLLQWGLAHYKDPLFTVRRMTVRQASDAMVQTSLGLGLQQRVTVNRRPNGGTLHGGDHLVQGWRESWGRDTEARWQMDFWLSPAEAQVYGGWGVGLWGSTFRWAY